MNNNKINLWSFCCNAPLLPREVWMANVMPKSAIDAEGQALHLTERPSRVMGSNRADPTAVPHKSSVFAFNAIILEFPTWSVFIDLEFKRVTMSWLGEVLQLVKCSSCLRMQASSVLSHWIPAKNMPGWRLCGTAVAPSPFFYFQNSHQLDLNSSSHVLSCAWYDPASLSTFLATLINQGFWLYVLRR